MIISMSDIICVTNSQLCRGDFLSRITEIAACRPNRVILREKHLSGAEYALLAGRVMEICQRYDVPCVLHSFVKEAIALGAENIHLPMHLLRTLRQDRQQFRMIGASVHSVQEAQEAEQLGAAYLTAGHIFDTDCKKGLPGRGLDFLSAVCQSVGIPVYAIGGITGANIGAVRNAGAAGACVMSTLMQCEQIPACLNAYGESL